MEQEKKDKKNILILIIGFFLISFAAVSIFYRQRSTETKNDKENDSAKLEEQLAQGKTITSSDLAKKILVDLDLTILDIRSRAEFDLEHIQNSKNIQPEELKFLKAGRTYVIVSDDSAADKITALARIIERSDATDYFFLTGGFLAWKSGYNPTVSAGDPDSLVDKAKVTYITSEELKNRIATEKNLLIIDLRKKESFAEGHIKDSINIPLKELENNKNSITLGKKAILYSDNELEAFQAAVRLYDLGIISALALADGIDGWKSKGFEVVK